MMHLSAPAQYNECNPLFTTGWPFSYLWEVNAQINMTSFPHQVQGTVRSEIVASCTGLGRRAHHSAQQMESFCLSSASLSTQQT